MIVHMTLTNNNAIIVSLGTPCRVVIMIISVCVCVHTRMCMWVWVCSFIRSMLVKLSVVSETYEILHQLLFHSIVPWPILPVSQCNSCTQHATLNTDG